MKGKELAHYKTQLFTDAIQGKKKPDRVPFFDNIYNWKVYDAGAKLSEAVTQPKVMKEVVLTYCKRYDPDVMADAGARNPVYFTRHYSDSQYYEIDDEGYRMNYRDHMLMDPSEYDEFIADVKKYIWSVYLPRKWDNLQKKENGRYFGESVSDFLSATMVTNSQTAAMTKLGVPQSAGIMDIVPFESGFEFLFEAFRGIKGISLDLRRCPDKVEAATQALEEFFAQCAEPNTTYGHNKDVAFDLFLPLLAHTILRAPQFGKLIWPNLKRLGDYCAQYNKTCFLFVEGTSERFYDYFRDLPKGHFAIYTEQNDIFEMRSSLPDLCIAGGLPSSLLGNGTPEECKAYTKKLCEELGADGKYILSEDKMLSFPNDATRENLLAVYDYVHGGQH